MSTLLKAKKKVEYLRINQPINKLSIPKDRSVKRKGELYKYKKGCPDFSEQPI